jgi:DNA-binding transcriptional ArsR family regulator
MDRSMRTVSSINSEADGVAPRRADEIGFVPPVLSPERAEAMYNLKPALKALADVNRLAILQELSHTGGLSVLDLSDRLMLSQPLTSWHLHILKRASLVKPTNRGRQRIYRLDRERLKDYRDLFQWVTDL